MGKTNTTPTADPNQNAITDPAPEEKKAPEFTIARLREDCAKLFGVTSCVFDGATRSVDAKKTFTVEAMKTHIKEWMAKPAVPRNK